MAVVATAPFDQCDRVEEERGGGPNLSVAGEANLVQVRHRARTSTFQSCDLKRTVPLEPPLLFLFSSTH